MGNKNKGNFIDDGRTIVDMTGVERPALFGRNFKEEKNKTRRKLVEPEEGALEKPWEQNKNKISKEERNLVIKGALKASILVWLCYALVFGIVILIMFLIFKGKLGI